jgi:arabinofuranosyltransferase
MEDALAKMQGRRIAPVFLIVASVAIFSYLVSRYWLFTVDDAFITFRYARNLASGYGPVFNPGMQPAEGYSSVLWMLIMAIPHRLGHEAVIFAKIVGVAATVGYMAVACRFVSRFSKPLGAQYGLLASALALFILASFSSTAIHAVSGMETALYTFLLTSFLFLLCVLVSAPSQGRAFSLAVLCLLVGLARPEGNLPVSVGLCWALWKVPSNARRFLAKASLFGFVVPGAAYFLWRAHYYGTLLPLPFYVKVLHQEAFRITINQEAGVSFAILGLRTVFAGVLVLLYLSTEIFPAVLAASSLLVFFGIPSHAMGYAWRFDFPVIPFLFVLLAIGIARLHACIESGTSSSRNGIRIPAMCMAWLICLLPAGLLATAPGRIRWVQAYVKGVRNAHLALGNRLRSLNSSTSPPVIALCDAGIIPYYSEWRTIDFCGLNNASLALSGKHNPEQVLSQNPDLVVLVSRKADSYEERFPGEQALYTSSSEKGMRRMKTLTFLPDAYYLWVMAIPGSASAESMLDWK